MSLQSIGIILCLWLQSSERFQPPPGTLVNPELREFQSQVREDRYEGLEKNWMKTCDPENQLAIETKEKLWNGNVALELRDVLASTKIDRLGVSVETTIYGKHKKSIEGLPKTLSSRLVGKDVLTVCAELPEISEELGVLSGEASTSIGLFVQIRSQKIEGKKECWMICEIGSIPKGWPMYPATLFYRLSCRNKPTTKLLPHPDQELLLALLAEKLKEPLEPNRQSGAEKFMDPLPPIQDDGLSSAQRELLYDFSIVDDVRKGEKQFQVEQVTIFFGDSKVSRSDIFEVFNRRLSRGTVVTKDDLNKICAEFTSRCRKVKFYDGEHFMFVVTPFQHGNFEYAQIMIHKVKR